MNKTESIPREAVDDALREVAKRSREGLYLKHWDWKPGDSGTSDPRGHWTFTFTMASSGSEGGSDDG